MTKYQVIKTALGQISNKGLYRLHKHLLRKGKLALNGYIVDDYGYG